MDKIEIDNKIVVYKNIDKDPMSIINDANLIINQFPNLGFKSATINNHEYNTDLRSCTVFSLNTESRNHDNYFGQGSKIAKDKLNAKINKQTFSAMLDYCKTYDYKISYKESWELLSYAKTQKLTWHADNGDVHPCQISFVYYFNDDYEGGEVEFKDFIGKPYKPNAGDLLIFPSSVEYVHRVLPITSGIKYNAISFAR